MNIFKKIYCRVFQGCFHIAIPILPYRDPKILNSIEELPQEFARRGISKVLLVTDPVIRSLTGKLETLLPENGIECVVYDKTNANPTVSNVDEALAVYVGEKCQALIGFGGGSSIDCAKAVGARVACPHKSLERMKGILKIHRSIPLLAAIPTTAGTGSETTVTTVITDDKTHYKYPISDFPLIPRIAVLDPTVTFTLPASLTATTGMDAMTHAVEAFIGGSTTRKTRDYSIRAVKLIIANIEKAYKNGQDENARRNMLLASNLAGGAFSRSYVGYVHAVAHSLGGKYNVPHGLANAIILPYVLEEFGKKAHKKLAELSDLLSLCEKSSSKEEKARAFIAWIKELNRSMEIPEKFDIIFDEKDVDEMIKNALKEANPLYPVPKEFFREDFIRIYRTILK